MAIKVPGNPFGVDVQVGSTQEMGLQSAKESEFSARKQFEGLSGTFGKAMEAMQLDIDETVTRDNMMALNSAVDDVLHNKDTGALNRKGKDALVNVNGLSLNDEVQEELKRRYDSIAKGAYNARQKQALSKYYGNVAMNVQQKISAHVIKQQAVYRADVRDHENEIAIKQIIDGDAEAVASGLMIVRKNAEEVAKELGIKPDYASALGEVHVIKATQLASQGKPREAQAWLREHKNEIPSKLYGTTMASVEKSVRDLEDFETAQDIFLKANGKGSDALKAVRQLDSDRQVGVKKYVQSLISTQEAIRNQEKKEATAAAWSYVLDPNNQGKTIVLPMNIRQDMEETNPTGLIRLQKYIDAKNTGQSIKTNPDVWESLYQEAMNEPEKFRQRNLQESLSELSVADFKYFTRLQQRQDDVQAKTFMSNVRKKINSDPKLKKYKYEIESAAARLWGEAADGAKGGFIDEAKRTELEKSLFVTVSDGGWFGSAQKGWQAINTQGDLKPSEAMFQATYGISQDDVSKAFKNRGYTLPTNLSKAATEEAIYFAKNNAWSYRVLSAARKWADSPAGETHKGETNGQVWLRQNNMKSFDTKALNLLAAELFNGANK